MDFLRFIRSNAPWLAAGVLLSFSSSFGQTFFISIFAGAIREDFGLSHGGWGGIYTLGTTASAVVMVWAGGLTDRFRARALGTIVLLGLAASCLAMAAVPVVWMLPGVIFLLRFLGQGMASHTALVAIARWFAAGRGKALSCATMGFALGQAVLPIAFVAMMQSMGWRALWVVSAGFVLLAIPILLVLLRHERTPQSMAHESQSLGMGQRHWRRGEVLRHWLFWLAVPMLMGPAAFGTALFFQQVHLSNIKGWELVEFVALLPLYTAVSVVAMFGSGWVIDRIGTARLMPLFLLPMAAGFLVLGLFDSLSAAAFAMTLIGLSVGANATLPAAFWAEFYGTRNLGSIKAMAAAVMVLGSALGPGLTGLLIDLGVSFTTQLLAMAVYFVVAATLVGIGVARARVLLAVPA